MPREYDPRRRSATSLLSVACQLMDSGYLLGEFGHLIANEPGCSPIEQFQALHGKVNLCTAPTRALLLTTYVKWVNLFPEIKDHLIHIFQRYTHVLDAELQQRACEYLALAQLEDNGDLLATLCDEMPIFPERESALLNRLHSKGETAQDKRTWVIGHSTDNRDRQAERLKGMKPGAPATNGHAGPSTRSAGAAAGAAAANTAIAQAESDTKAERDLAESSLGPDAMMGTTSNGAREDIMSSLADLDLSGGDIQEEPLIANGSVPAAIPSAIGGESNGTAVPETATLGGVDPKLLAPLTVGKNIDKVS